MFVIKHSLPNFIYKTMKKSIFIFLSILFVYCGSDDDFSGNPCEFSNVSWSRSSDSIVENNGITVYRVNLMFDIANRTNDVSFCEFIFISKKDENGNRFGLEGPEILLLNPNETLTNNLLLSNNYLTGEIIDLGVDYVEVVE